MLVGQDQPVVVPSRRVDVRRLQRADGPGLEALLDGEPGYSLFLRGNLGALAVDDRVQYWGVVVDGAPRAALMLVGNRGALYAPPGGPIAPLAEIAAEHGLGFAMGRTDLVEALVASSPGLALTRRQEHVLARLARADLAPPYAPPAVPLPPLGVRVRRARPGDLGGLVRLYTGAAGFERATPARVRASLRERVLSLRTHVARARGRILAAASTSSEAPRAAMIGGVWTDPAWRGRGVGTAVVAALARELLAEGRAPHLFYLVDNAPAARVYAKIGFRPVGPWTVVYFDR